MRTPEEFAKSILPELIAFRREMHRHPELSMAEYEATQRVCAVLDAYGIEWKYVNKEEKLGVYTVLSGDASDEELILLRGDMDALPVHEETELPFTSENEGCMHACGHDLNTAYVLGAAILLHEYRHLLKHQVMVLFQCGEETLEGGPATIAAGLFDRQVPKYGIAFHTTPDYPAGKLAMCSGPAMAAADELTLTVRGKGGHAARPHQTIDPIVIASHIVVGLQTLVARYHVPADPLVISFGVINGGTVSNQTPDTVRLEGTVRSFDRTLREELPGKIERACKGIAHGFGGDCDVRYEYWAPAIVVPEELYKAASSAICSTLGEEHFVKRPGPQMGSEDFGYYTELMPCGQVGVGTSFEDPASRNSLHSSGVVFSEDSIYWGMMAGFALGTQME